MSHGTYQVTEWNKQQTMNNKIDRLLLGEADNVVLGGVSRIIHKLCFVLEHTSIICTRVTEENWVYRRIIQQYNNNDDNDNESKASSTKNKEGPAIPAWFQAIAPYAVLCSLGRPTKSKWLEPRSGVFGRVVILVLVVPFDQFGDTISNGRKVSPVGWEIDPKSFWLEEHGIWMEAPRYNLQPGRYLVTGGRLRTSVLTIHPADENGVKNWSLDGGVLYDVTHLPCRSALYVDEGNGGSPLNARREDFPVTPGAEMPQVEGCKKQDYAVLFVTGVEDV
ncbi:hypothetical protein QTG54_004534 [Skeletonema marinoi]|uniref:Uncharacterized protein n=1 Tax=Skeletonema marinoi TaxID=267567 RepID=A0AAD9DGY6_9STRA|nr:hypothetical protein QTG54_004534 [Skeletonema marinoi]